MAGMTRLGRLIDRIPLPVVGLLCLTLGLAPFVPAPHLLEKLGMLWAGVLTDPVDVFDLVLHGAPWLLLAMKLARRSRRRI